MSTILEARHIIKEFPGVRALDDVTFSLEKNQIHALCGENGAGKSTLINILSGVYPVSTYEGEILLEGNPVHFKTIREARQAGIAVIHQELSLFGELSVAENLFMGQEMHTRGILKWNEMLLETEEWLKKLKLEEISPHTKISELGIGQQQLIEIARALRMSNVKVLILDEPTASLTEKETEILLTFLRELRAQGTSCIYISHKVEEVMQIADYVTVLRDGKTVGGGSTKTLKKEDIIRMMVGREISDLYPKRGCKASDEVILEIKDYCVREKITGKQIVSNASFKLHKGEVLGLYGLIGAGRTELMSSVYGSNTWERSGEVIIAGNPVKIKSPRDALKAGLTYLTEDRKAAGIIGTMSVRENTSITFLEKFKTLLGINEPREVVTVKEQIEKLRVKTPSTETKIINLSGGNQQKVLLARCLLEKINIIILDEPTRGIDIGAKHEIYQIINTLVEEGVSIIMVSSELPEILGMCDRVIVMGNGRVMGEFDNKDRCVTQESILISATGMKCEV